MNYPPGVPGPRVRLRPVQTARPVGVLNVMGRTFMPPVDDPFRAVGRGSAKNLAARTKIIVVDVHAEATSEKVALGRYP